MGTQSKIEWTDHTFNPWLGCTKITPGCDRCYAESWSKRSGLVRWGKNPRRRTSVGYWRMPVRWNELASKFEDLHGRRQRVFCASLADVFDNQVEQQWRVDLFELIQKCGRLDWLLLTKRPENIAKMLPTDWGGGYPNVWLGTTTEDQKRYQQRWPHLSRIACAVRFISYEPAIGPLRLPAEGPHPDWLISGGESGGGARVLNQQWVRDVLADCERSSIAPFHKQWGSYASNPLVFEAGLPVEVARRRDVYGKGGGLIDGRLVRKFPDHHASIVIAA
jgi:protein gp37